MENNESSTFNDKKPKNLPPINQSPQTMHKK